MYNQGPNIKSAATT